MIVSLEIAQRVALLLWAPGWRTVDFGDEPANGPDGY